MKHEDGGSRCVVAHIDEKQCIKCKNCEEWITPSDFLTEECNNISTDIKFMHAYPSTSMNFLRPQYKIGDRFFVGVLQKHLEIFGVSVEYSLRYIEETEANTPDVYLSEQRIRDCITDGVLQKLQQDSKA